MPPALQLPNVRHFIWFRTLFNARFYYPIFTLLFLDYGLTLEQFAVLNAAWAVTIVLAEVPSGALADVLGRRRLVVLAAVLMVVEMLVIALVPLGHMQLVFWAFLVNRLLSGLAEACASGADEALAYDSLKQEGLEAEWPKVLERVMKVGSVAMFAAMITGALVYDPGLLSKLAGWMGADVTLTRNDVLRLPVWLTLASAVATLYHALRLRPLRTDPADISAGLGALKSSFAQTWSTGKWVAGTPFVLVVILAGLASESVLRLFATLLAEYLRQIELPEASFGLISSGFTLIAFAMGTVGRWLVEHRSPLQNFLLITVLGTLGLLGCALAVPWWGILPALLAMSMMPLISFFLSHYLNRDTPSERRATVLSFRGLALHLGYGGMNIAYLGIVAGIKAGIDAEGEALQQAAFSKALWWFGPGQLALAAGLLIAAPLILRQRGRKIARKTG